MIEFFNGLDLPDWFSEPLKVFFQKHILLTGIIINLLSAILGFLYNSFRRTHYSVIRIRRKIRCFFTRTKYIIIWNDDSVTVSANIRDALNKKFELEGFKFNTTIIDSPDKLLYYPPSTKQIAAIILIVSDVTKLSDIDSERQLIQSSLIKYINSGGILIGTHDIIYRRTRNEELKKVFGYEWKDFDRCNSPIKVEINKNYKDHPLLRNIPKSFSLDDGEVIWGDSQKDIEKDVAILINTFEIIPKAAKKVPMLCVRKISSKDNNGIAVWLSSCDKGDKLAKSLSPPQKEIIQIFYNAITLSNEIKDY